MDTNLEDVTMLNVAQTLFVWDCARRGVLGSEDAWSALSDEERALWYSDAVSITDIAGPVWRAREDNFDSEGYRWAVVAPNGQVFDQRSKGDALSLAYATGMRVVREHRDGGGYSVVDR